MHKEVDKCTQYGIMIVIVTFMCEKLVCVVFFKKKVLQFALHTNLTPLCKKTVPFTFSPYILDTNQQDMEEREK